jgi:predicted MPP superfamily phosphohydrolase
MIDTRNPSRTGWWLAVLAPWLLFAGAGVLFLIQAMVAPTFLLVRQAYDFITLVSPGLLIVSGVLALAWARRKPLKRQWSRMGALNLVAALLLIATRVYATHVEPNRLLVREVVLPSSKITRPITLLHLSDIQSNGVGAHEERVFARIREIAPDLILYTGDLVQPLPPLQPGEELARLARLFATLHPPGGIFGVFGDVDEGVHGVPPGDLGGLRLLESEGVRIELDGTRFHLFGLSLAESRHARHARQAMERWQKDHRENEFSLLLGHAPDFALDIAEQRIDLCLAGHTHGGQIRILGLGPIFTLSRVPRDWARGTRVVGRSRLSVSAGIGAEHAGGLPSIRLGCPPEMTVFRLVPGGKMVGPGLPPAPFTRTFAP